MGDRGVAIRNLGGPAAVGRKVAQLAARQHGILTATQLMELGLSRQAIRWRVTSGRLHALHRGVYAVGHTLVSRHGQYLAAVMACGPEAALSHRSAADLWGLRRDSSRIEVTVPRGRAGHPAIAAHRSRMMDARDLTSVDRIRVTSVARTLLDLASVLSSVEVNRAVDRAERLELFDGAALEELLGRCGGRAGAAQLGAAITGWRPTHTRSELEDRFQELLRAAGLPLPDVNVLLVGERQAHEADCHWPGHGLVVQLDGFAYHRTRRDRERDASSDADLELAGLRVVRLTWDEVVVRGWRTARRLGRLLATSAVGRAPRVR